MTPPFTFTFTHPALGRLDITYTVQNDATMCLVTITSRPWARGRLMTRLFWGGANGWRENISVKYFGNGRRDEAIFASDNERGLPSWWQSIYTFINSPECAARCEKDLAKKLKVLQQAHWPKWIDERIVS